MEYAVDFEMESNSSVHYFVHLGKVIGTIHERMSYKNLPFREGGGHHGEKTHKHKGFQDISCTQLAFPTLWSGPLLYSFAFKSV